MMRTSLVALSCVAAAASPLRAQERPPVPALLAQAVERYEQLDAMCARFDQRLEVPLLATEVLSAGQLCSKQPAYFRMDFTEPDGDAVVADGQDLWVYFPSSQPGQVLRSPLGDGASVDFTREFLADPGQKYEAMDEGTDVVTGRDTRRYALRPIVQGLGYTYARVWIDTGQAIIRRVEIHQENGSIRHVTLSSIDLAPSVTAADFRFTRPDGVQIVSLGGGAGVR